MKILTLQPYYGESHRQFIDGWMANSRHEWRSISLPSRHWKWRMRHAAIEFASQIKSLPANESEFDLIIVTDMLNVAELKGLLSMAGGRMRDVPVLLYFHENQFAYPNQFELGTLQAARDEHFPFTNFVSALAADKVWFNSRFNRDSMMQGLKDVSKRWPDHCPKHEIETVSRGEIEPPGIDAPDGDFEQALKWRRRRGLEKQPIRLVWAARWEHDKNPAGLLAALRILKSRGVPFELTALGQSFRETPPEFASIQDEFEDNIRHWGFVEARKDYWQWLADGDVFFSTANHEFFGLAAAEGIAAGLIPLFPDRLAYPELVRRLVDTHVRCQERDPSQFLYAEGDLQTEAKNLADQIEQIVACRRRGQDWMVPESQRQSFISDLVWPARAQAMDRRVEAIVAERRDKLNLW